MVWGIFACVNGLKENKDYDMLLLNQRMTGGETNEWTGTGAS